LILEKIAILGQPPGGCALHTNQNTAHLFFSETLKSAENDLKMRCQNVKLFLSEP